MRAFRILVVPVICLLAAASSSAEQAEQRPVDINGWSWLTLSRFVETSDTFPSENIEGEYFVDCMAGLRFVRNIGRYSKARVHVAGQIVSYIDVPGRANAEFTRWRFSPVPIDITLESNFSEGRLGRLSTELGYFPVRYNPQARNLGEYLFRSWAYPPILISGFESADKVKQLGGHLRWDMPQCALGTVRHDAYITSELDLFPSGDISASYLFAWRTPRALLDMGGGVNYSHLIPLNDETTTPGLDSATRRHMNNFDYVDPVSGDTTLYTFRGVKLMGRITLDPKVLWSEPGRVRTTRLGSLSAEDLKVYAEVAVLGVENYAGWYENRRERIPVMAGFNVPTFGLLDVLSVEVQYYGSNYANNPYIAWGNRSPAPYWNRNYDDSDTWDKITNDNWKWSIYATRTIAGFLRLSLGAQSDHLQAVGFYNPFPYFRFAEMVPATKDWYWMARLSYAF